MDQVSEAARGGAAAIDALKQQRSVAHARAVESRDACDGFPKALHDCGLSDRSTSDYHSAQIKIFAVRPTAHAGADLE
jgi:hypothetical protein